jgi:predicted negative regulator of RcsB-dependent stress response
VDPYVTEDQQVEALAKWWKENGSSIIVGVVLGLAIVFSVRIWTDWRAGKAEAASAVYQQVQGGLEGGNATAVQEAGMRLMEEYPNSTYAVLGALAQAAVLAEKGDLAGAQGRLEWALNHATDPHLKALAQLRLARLVLDGGNPARALELGEAAATAGFGAEYDNLHGDVLRVQGDREGARSAYQAALDKLPAGSRGAEDLRMKLDGLGGEG